MNSLQNLIQRLSAIGQVNEEAEEKCTDCSKAHEGECAVEESKKPDADKDGIPDWADKKDDKEEVDEGAMDKLKAFGKKALDTLGHGDDEDLIKDMQKKAGVPQTGKKPEEKEVKESALDLLRRYAGIQEATIDDVEEVNECGMEMPMGDMSPMSSVPNGEPHMGIPAQVMAQMAAPEQGPEMAQPQVGEPPAPKATYTLNITNGDNNLSMTTDVPDEIIHIMKLAGVNKGADVSKKEVPQGGEQEVEESGYENTPDNTRARDPQAHGDIRDWGKKGTANASTHYTPAQSGDNPMNEQRMFQDYKNFKAGK
jgi:hypothetical protein